MLQAHFFIRGNKETISKRLKTFYKNKRIGQKVSANSKQGGNNRRDKFYDYVCVVDFECTCQEGENTDYPHEIIEFPIVLLKTATLEVVSDTQFVRFLDFGENFTFFRLKNFIRIVDRF